MSDVVIVAAGRTAIGSFGGSLSTIPAATLGAKVIANLLSRTGIPAEAVDDVILGQVLTAGVGMNPARQAAIGAGLPHTVPCMTINKVCGSGLKAVALAAQAIRAGDAEIVVAGGQENMSLAPHVLPGSRNGQKMGEWKLVDTMVNDGLWDIFNNIHMGITAENIVKKYQISREEQDAFAALSQQRAEAAQKAGRFKDEIIPIEIPQKKGDPIVFDTDEFPRHGTTAESLAKLRPAFDEGGYGDGRQCLRDQRRRGRRDRHERRARQGPRPHAAVPHRRLCERRGGPGHHGHRPHPGHAPLPGEGGLEGPGPRPDRGQRGLRGPGHLGEPRSRLGPRPGQRQRRGHRARPPDRRLRGARPLLPPVRDETPRCPLRSRDALHRRRPGDRPSGRT